MARTANLSASKPRAISLHIGLNAVSPAQYEGWSGELNACEFDAKDMAAIAKSQGMESALLLTANGTRAKALAAVRAAAKQLKGGDLFFLTYSGHGGQVPDVSGEEDDKKDETWCLYDGQLIDDELYLELGRFKPGVRILMLSDSCHSGTMARAFPPPLTLAGRSKAMPGSVAMRTYGKHQAFYDKLQHDVAKAARKTSTMDPDSVLAGIAVSPRLTALANKFGPAVVLISGCQDNQTSSDGDHNGAFTEQLLRVWNHGAFKGNYAKFHATTKAGMPASQSPNLYTLGAAADFIRQAPFQI